MILLVDLVLVAAFTLHVDGAFRRMWGITHASGFLNVIGEMTHQDHLTARGSPRR